LCACPQSKKNKKEKKKKKRKERPSSADIESGDEEYAAEQPAATLQPAPQAPLKLNLGAKLSIRMSAHG
jgi:hypothetical protein